VDNPGRRRFQSPEGAEHSSRRAFR
jgi:hypothetical protein